MAASPYVWGIDIGKCSLKALRCRVSPTDPRRLIAEAFDVVEYPTMLSQPEADPAALVRAALAEFMSRNTVTGDRVAVSAPGQSGLAKFIKLPPVEAKKIPDIVKYEAGQQIPFPLDQVVWDWQRLATGMEEGGFVMDAEVALFAMKREQVAKVLAPFQEAGIEVEILQMAPIALANMAMFDQLPAPATIDPENPPPSLVLVSIGVDSTDLVVTNGLRVWQRSMPIGGSSFTKALVQDLKYTFAKAEKEKRNAVRAADPRAVFKAMKPVFNQFASELQRSLNYFTGSDRSAKIGKVFLLGNAAKLRGLSDFVSKQLQLDVQRLESFAALEGPAVSSPVFRDNRMSFGTAYGLALQAAKDASIKTSLLPREIARDRMIAAKRPWAVAAMLALLAAGLANFSGWFASAASYDPAAYRNAFAASDSAKSRAAAAKAAVEEAEQRLRDTVAWERYLVEVYDRRFQSLDLLRALTAVLPRDEADAAPEGPADRREIHIDSLDMEYVPDLAVWFQGINRDWERTLAAAGKVDDRSSVPAPPADGQPPADVAAGGDPAAPAAEDPAAAAPAGPSGPGWVVQIVGHHFHNEDRHKPSEGEQFVRETLVRGLLGDAGPVLVSAGAKAGEEVTVTELGIGYPVIVQRTPVTKVKVSIAQAVAGLGAAPGGPPAADQPEEEQFLQLKQYAFVLQFAWQPRSPGSLRPPAESDPVDAGISP
ncbi:MAG: type IV pilus assembly protein PilM [Planctomycetota bacterium]